MPTSLNARLTGAATLLLATLAILAPQSAAARAHHRVWRCSHTNTPANRASRAVIKRSVVCLINRQRVARGLPPLRENSRLDRSSQGWTNTMVHTDQFWHGSDFAARISAVGFVWSRAGENIASGFRTPRQVVDAWMASTGHCQNILNPGFSRVGTGVVDRGVRPYGGDTWTQDFALPQGARMPSGNTRPMDGCPYRVR